MRALVQRVNEARVLVDGKEWARVGRGLLVYLGIHERDTDKEADWIVKRIIQARVFDNEGGRMTHSVVDIRGEILVVSQITLYGDFDKGNRPDMSSSMKPREAKELYERFISKLKDVSGLEVKEGQFGARMNIESVNHGPVTLLIEA